MSGQTNRCRTVLAICTGIGQGIDIDRADLSVFHCSQPYRHFHLMPWGRCGLGFLSAVNDHRRFSGLPGDKSRENFRYHRLFCPESTADSRFADTDL